MSFSNQYEQSMNVDGVNAYITSCASLLSQSNDTEEIMDVLERLESVEITIETLKETRIGVIVNKLAKRNDIATKIQTFAWQLVNNWKEIATASVEQERLNPTYSTPATPISL